MFRKMRRSKQELTKEECIEILKKEPRGVLSVQGEDGYVEHELKHSGPAVLCLELEPEHMTGKLVNES